MTLSVGFGEALANRGEIEGGGRVEAFKLEALAKNCVALEVTWVGGLVGRVECLTGTGLLSFSDSNVVVSPISYERKRQRHIMFKIRP